MAVTNLTGTTWVFNESVSTTTGLGTYNINFISNGQNFVQIYTTYRGYTPIDYIVDDGNTINAYNNSVWTNEAYRTIVITGGEDVNNESFISFLIAAATQKLEFTETKTALKIYEDLTQDEYNGLEKDNNTFYQVNDVGVYKGTKLIAKNKPSTAIYYEKQVEKGTDSQVEISISEPEMECAYLTIIYFYGSNYIFKKAIYGIPFVLGRGEDAFPIYKEQLSDDYVLLVQVRPMYPGVYIKISGMLSSDLNDVEYVKAQVYKLTDVYKPFEE